MKKICVLGAGTMGAGIAQAFAAKGYEVIVRDIKDEFVQKGLGMIEKNIKKLATKGKITEEQAEEILSRVSGTTELSLLDDVDLIIEAAVENMEIKRQIFKELDEICKPEAILATRNGNITRNI